MNTFEKIDEMRVKLRNKYIFFIVLGLILFLLFLLYFDLNLNFIYFLIVIYIIVVFIFTHKPAREYKLAFKDFFVKSSLIKIFTNLDYNPEKGLSENVIASTNMMYMGDRYSSNDLMTGCYKDIGFTQADVHIEDKRRSTDSDGNTHTYYVTLFRGRWMIFDFNKRFKANVQVCQKGFGNNKVNSLFSNNKLQKVEMESQKFNDLFSVYAKEPIDAFYILTPKIMEKIENLDSRNKGKLLLCFVDNKLHVGIYNNKDSFEPGSVFFKIKEDKVIDLISQDILKITMFVDELELDNDLFNI